MGKKKSSWKHKLAAVGVSFLMIAIVLLLGEAFCRLFTRINFLDNSKGLFTANRYGKSYGNTPNFEGISFGEKFNTDADGFRIDPGFSPALSTGAPAVLMLGDSVAFGTAVNDKDTIAGILRRRMPSQKIYNAAAIGYDTFDYKNVAQQVIEQKPEIKTVLLFYCLNDVNDISAQQIKQQGNSAEAAPEQPSLIRQVNDFLRSRSKLYLVIKSLLQDTQMLYFQNDLAYYRKDENVQYALRPVADLKETLDAAGVKLKVFIMPYEAQLRPNSPEDFLLPQKKVAQFMKAHNIECYDTFADFKKTASPDRLFLFGDPMHLSAEGHKLAADLVCGQLEEKCETRQ
jgi:lysophospholipase L1-like esterase